MSLNFNADVIVSCVVSSNDTLEEVLQLGEVQAGLRLSTPADQHQLISVVMLNKREGNYILCYSTYNILLLLYYIMPVINTYVIMQTKHFPTP